MHEWVVFDLDETVIDHDTFSRFLVHLLRRDSWRVVLAFLVLPIAGLFLAARRLKALGASLLLWIATIGVSDEDFANLADDYVTNLAVASRCYPGAVTEIETLFDAGYRVAVVTASAEVLARRIVQEIDPRLTLSGSRLKRVAGGLVAAEHCYGANKVLHVRALCGTVHAAYSDSSSDTPMFRVADEVVLVNAPPKVERRVRRALADDQPLRCVMWRKAS